MWFSSCSLCHEVYQDLLSFDIFKVRIISSNILFVVSNLQYIRQHCAIVLLYCLLDIFIPFHLLLGNSLMGIDSKTIKGNLNLFTYIPSQSVFNRVYNNKMVQNYMLFLFKIFSKKHFLNGHHICMPKIVCKT